MADTNTKPIIGKNLETREKIITLLRERLAGTRYANAYVGTTMSEDPEYPVITVTCQEQPVLSAAQGTLGFNPYTGKRLSLTVDQLTIGITATTTVDEESRTILETVKERLGNGKLLLPLSFGLAKMYTDRAIISDTASQTRGSNKVYETVMTIGGQREQKISSN